MAAAPPPLPHGMVWTFYGTVWTFYGYPWLTTIDHDPKKSVNFCRWGVSLEGLQNRRSQNRFSKIVFLQSVYQISFSDIDFSEIDVPFSSVPLTVKVVELPQLLSDF